MAYNFVAGDRDQLLLMPPSLAEWLPVDHLAWFVLDVVGELDVSAFVAVYRADGRGGAAYDPSMMVALLVYAYCVGERSSRVIERRCREDVAFRVIAANRAPDHTTIARFRAGNDRWLAELVTQVLALCAKAGMVRVGTVAVDGSKLAANAGLSANRGYAAIRAELEKMLAEAAASDAAEDARLGDRGGDELPAELAEPVSRHERLQRAAAELAAEQQARVDAHEAKRTAREEYREPSGRNMPGRPLGPGPGSEPPTDAKRNITDPDS